GEDVPHTFRALGADGSVKVIEANVCNRLDDPSVRAVVVNYRDVTDRETAARVLARQHALLEGRFSAGPDGVCYKDRELRFLGGNPAFEQLAGRPVADVLGKTCEEVFPGGWIEQLRAIELAVLVSGQTARTTEWLDYPDGRRVLLDIAVSPLHD